MKAFLKKALPKKPLFKKISLKSASLTMVTLLLAVLTFSLAFALLTHTGNQWLWRLACLQLPELKGELAKGSLINTLEFENLGWSQKDVNVSTQNLSLQIRVKDLLNKQLTINTLLIRELNVQLKPVDNSAPAETKPLKLPEIKLPLPINIERLAIENARFQQGETVEKISKLSLSAQGKKSLMELKDFEIVHPLASARLSGKLNLTGNYPLSLLATIQPNLNNETINQLPVQPDTVHIALRGSLKDYQLELSTAFQPSENLPITSRLAKENIRAGLAVAATGSLEAIDIQKLALSAPGQGSFTLSGKLNWREGINWKGVVTVDSFKTDLLLPDYPGIIDGQLSTQFKTANTGWQFSIPELSLKGNLNHQTLSATGTLTVNSQFKGRIEQFVIHLGNNQLTAQGSLDKQWDMEVNLSAKEPGLLHPQLSGEINGFARLKGSTDKPDINYELKSSKLTFAETSIHNLLFSGTLKKEREFKGDARLEFDSIEQASPLLEHTLLTLSGTESSHRAEFTTVSKYGTGSLDLTGSLKNKAWRGTLNKTDLTSPLGEWALKSPADIQYKNKTVELSNLCLQSAPSELCVKDLSVSSETAQAALDLSHFNSSRISHWFPKGFDWQAQFSASSAIHWDKKQPTLHIQIESTPGHIKVSDIEGDYRQLSINSRIQNNQLTGTLNFDSHTFGQSDLNLIVDDLENQRNLKGKLVINQFLLSVFSPFLSDLENLNGTLSADNSLGGTLKQPLLYGKLSLNDGTLSSRRNIAKITDTNINLVTKGNSATVSGSLKLNKGILRLGGDLDWRDAPDVTGKIVIKGNELEINYPGYGKVELSPDLTLLLAKKIVQLHGSITIPKADIDIKSLPDNAVPLSDDIEVVKKGEPKHIMEEGHERFEIDVDIILGENIRLDAFGLKTKLQGRLELLQQPGKTFEGQGTITLIEGRLRKLGQDLLIKEGEVIFQGPVNSPYLIVNAYRNPDTIQDDVVVGINLSGPISKPQWTVYSNPAMSQEEQLSYLLRGRALSAEGDSLASTLVGLGVGQLGGFTSTVGDSLGIEELTLDTEGSGDDTQITIGGYIAPGLRLQYGAGVFNSIGEIKLRYELMPKLYLQVVSGLDQAVDLFYRFTIRSTDPKEL